MNRLTPEKGPVPEAPGAGASLNSWLDWLETIHPSEIDLGLDRVMIVFRRLFPSRPAGRMTTVAGTNGKGTTVTALEALLLRAGRKTGTYTSPHLQRYNERVRINGREISDSDLVSAFEKVEEARGQVSLTYFEFGTLAAFVAFAAAGVEDWILEVGLGGRLDAVNVLDADYVAITAIDLDHIGFLGDNRESIGFEKAGVLRPGIFAVCADPQPPSSVLQQAAAQKVQLKLTGHDYRLLPSDDDPGQTVLCIGQEQFALPSGALPVESIAAAVVLSRQLVPELPDTAVSGVLESLVVPGRFEYLASHPDIIVDVGHNPHAACWLAGRIQSMKSAGRTVHAVYGALADKDVEGVVAAMHPVVDHWWLGGLAVPRGLSGDALRARVAAATVSRSVHVHSTVTEALKVAMATADCSDLLIVFGSFYTVGEAREYLLGRIS